MVKFRKIAFLTMAAVLLSTCATGISNLSESRVGGQYTVYAAETQADAGESVATLTDATATVKNKKGWYTKNGKTYYYELWNSEYALDYDVFYEEYKQRAAEIQYQVSSAVSQQVSLQDM